MPVTAPAMAMLPAVATTVASSLSVRLPARVAIVFPELKIAPLFEMPVPASWIGLAMVFPLRSSAAPLLTITAPLPKGAKAGAGAGVGAGTGAGAGTGEGVTLPDGAGAGVAATTKPALIKVLPV